MIYTSYFAKNGNHPNAVSIAGKTPEFFQGRKYSKLAPKLWFFKKYKEDGDKDDYIKNYYKEVLDKLDPTEVYKELGEGAVLLCYEAPDKFCHRHLVSEWLMKNKIKSMELFHHAD
jgi:hypothetical protein